MAKSFQFRLEKVLDVRRLQEKSAQRELAVAQQAVAERNRIILGLMGQEDDAKREVRALQERAVDVAKLRLAGEYAASLERLLQREYETLQAQVLVEMRKRQQLTEARKSVRVLEKLRDKQARIHRQGTDLDERNFLDELGRRTA
jgi:flagellar export protein FliJ